MPPRKLTRNAAECLKCGDTIESKHRYDFKWCTCGNVAVDGGLEYVRRAYMDAHHYRDRNEYEECD